MIRVWSRRILEEVLSPRGISSALVRHSFSLSRWVQASSIRVANSYQSGTPHFFVLLARAVTQPAPAQPVPLPLGCGRGEVRVTLRERVRVLHDQGAAQQAAEKGPSA